MNKETAASHKQHAHDGGSKHPAHGPYWRRAHKDWKVWVGAILMAIALMFFVLTGDLGGLYRAPQQQAPPASGSHG